MTHPNTDFNAFEEAIQLLTQQGPEALAEAFRILLNHAMQAERSQVLSAQPYQRTPERKGHANGFKPKSLNTRLGTIEFAVPQVRGEVDFYPSALEKGVRSEHGLTFHKGGDIPYEDPIEGSYNFVFPVPRLLSKYVWVIDY